MHDTQVAIVGGGLAGSLAAAMLGRDGVDVVFIDPNKQYPAEFRCEKLDGDQMAILRRTGLADAVVSNSTHDREAWVARYGRIVEKRPGDQQGIFYASLVNTVRAEIPTNVRHIEAKATGITTSVDRQTVTLSNGEEVRARLVILANGLSLSLRDALKLGRETVSKCHSISIGFNMKPLGREAFPIAQTFAGGVGMGLAFAGSPASVRDWVARAREEAGITYMALEIAFGDISEPEAAQSAELFAREVAPHFPEA